MEFYKHEDYNEEDRLDVKEIQVLQMLKDGNYVIDPYIFAGKLKSYDFPKPGFNKVKVFWEIDEDANEEEPLVGLKLNVGDGDVVFEYDPSLEEWTCDDLSSQFGTIKEPFVEWIENEVDMEDYQEEEAILSTALENEDIAKGLLPDYPFYEIDGLLYYYVDPCDDNIYSISDEEQEKIDEQMEQANVIEFDEALGMFVAGDCELVDNNELDFHTEPRSVTKEEVIDLLNESSYSMTAREIAHSLDCSRRSVNQVLYHDLRGRVNRSDNSIPSWSMKPLEEQVENYLSDVPMAAAEIAQALRASKSEVNSILYKLESSIAEHDDSTPPCWYLK